MRGSILLFAGKFERAFTENVSWGLGDTASPKKIRQFHENML